MGTNYVLINLVESKKKKKVRDWLQVTKGLSMKNRRNTIRLLCHRELERFSTLFLGQLLFVPNLVFSDLRPCGVLLILRQERLLPLQQQRSHSLRQKSDPIEHPKHRTRQTYQRKRDRNPTS